MIDEPKGRRAVGVQVSNIRKVNGSIRAAFEARALATRLTGTKRIAKEHQASCRPFPRRDRRLSQPTIAGPTAEAGTGEVRTLADEAVSAVSAADLAAMHVFARRSSLHSPVASSICPPKDEASWVASDESTLQSQANEPCYREHQPARASTKLWEEQPTNNHDSYGVGRRDR